MIKETEVAMTPVELSEMARRLLRNLLADYYNILSLPEISVTENGKPFFPDYPDIHFSLSHCKTAVMAVIDSEEIGCDIEDIQKCVCPELIEYAFSAKEKQRILQSLSPELELTCLWTRKEAIVKRYGYIPDDPKNWRSDEAGIITSINSDKGYVFSISTSNSL